MRIRHLELEGFRGFCGREQFDLDADAVIISGANGRGKTSFLDAILWCLTGQLPRIGETADVVSLYSTTGEARVEITLGTRVSADAFSITRSCDRAGTVRVSAKDSSGWEGKGEEAEVAIRRRLWPAALESGGGPEAVAKAFTRSVYLEQDLIRQYLESDSDDERFAILSEIVGVGRITELQHYLATAKRAWSRGTTQVREEGKQWATEVQKLSAELERLGSITDSGQHIQSWETWWRSVAQRIDVPSPPGVSAEAKSHLEQALQALEEIQTQAKRRVARLVRLKGDLEELPPFDEAGYASLLAKIDAVEHDLYAAREALSVAQSEADTRRAALVREKEEAADLAALAEIALRHLGDNCPVCTQPYNEQQTRHHLNTLLTTRPRDPAEADDESHSGVEEALAVVEGLSSEFESLRQQTGDLEVHRRTRADAIERIESASEELGLEPSRYGDLNEKAVSGELQLAEDTLRETRTLIGQGESLSLFLVRLREESRRSTLEERLMDAKRKLAHFTRLVERREGTGIMCDKIVSALREGEEKVVQQEIERLQPLLKQIYSKIDPHPAFVDVALAATMYHGKGRLTPQLRDPLLTAPVTEPGKFLSSSQFNALAVSIFVAFNFGTTDLPLQAMLMDDPLQSLDDVNMLGLIDLLRRARSNRQVFISTHSDALARLLQRKLRAVGEHQRTVRLDFRGWSRLGPDVDHYDVPRERDRLRVVA